MKPIVVKNKDNYAILPTEHLADPRLSLGAKGLMMLMLDLDAWNNCTRKAIQNACGKKDKDCIPVWIQELESAGYIVSVPGSQGEFLPKNRKRTG